MVRKGGIFYFICDNCFWAYSVPALLSDSGGSGWAGVPSTGVISSRCWVLPVHLSFPGWSKLSQLKSEDQRSSGGVAVVVVRGIVSHDERLSLGLLC